MIKQITKYTRPDYIICTVDKIHSREKTEYSTYIASYSLLLPAQEYVDNYGEIHGYFPGTSSRKLTISKESYSSFIKNYCKYILKTADFMIIPRRKPAFQMSLLYNLFVEDKDLAIDFGYTE
jgi:hypothetical protein